MLLGGLALVAMRARAVTFAEVHAGTPLVLPRDYGSHADFRSEWWYVTGWLRAARCTLVDAQPPELRIGDGSVREEKLARREGARAGHVYARPVTPVLTRSRSMVPVTSSCGIE